MTRGIGIGNGVMPGRHDGVRAPVEAGASCPCDGGVLRREVAALVLRAVMRARSGAPGAAFVRRRAEGEVVHLVESRERRLLGKLLAVPPGEAGVTVGLLAAYAAELERGGRHREADVVLRLALRLRPASAELVLRSARIARLRGRRDRALRLYAGVRRLEGGRGRLSRLAAVGAALLVAEPEAALSRVIREAVRAGDGEAAAVGLEERAALRRAAGDDAGAARDLSVAAFLSGRARSTPSG
ncbi:MAG TPA: hypothetical protein VF212_03900 [Longimicrobiales bacterium]